ncbi:DUF1120 domain-containing protein (plasmid) [Hafnia alvei]|uniref:DUF1120 domain-containing protein n=1 Tax=Hafnia alvei TaxID=569 RepID=UPI001642F262|nr:DUF1120 domain-containing protein [Hafnia alvei]MBI0278584.1 DUF1120 domain-containing protein [Hafnia alvei]
MKFNKTSLFVGIACSVLSLNVLAASDTATLSVAGEISPGSCTPSLDGGGVVDYGHIDANTLTAVAPAANMLPTKTVSITITCQAATRVAYSTFDNRHPSTVQFDLTDAGIDGSVVDTNSSHFGLGYTAAHVPIGDYAIAMPVTATADGKSVDVLATEDNALDNWAPHANGIALTGDSPYVRYFTVGATGTNEPLAFTTVVIPMKISTGVQAASVLGTTDQVKLDGNTTFSLTYL